LSRGTWRSLPAFGAVNKVARLQSLVEILPDGSPNTTTINPLVGFPYFPLRNVVAGRLRTRPEWRGSAGQRLNLDYIERVVGKLVKAHPDLIKSTLKVSLRGFPELRIWRQRSDRPVPNR
jgi:hypothetical protein